MQETCNLTRTYDYENKSWRFVKRDKGSNTQLFMLEDTFSRFGLVRNEARVYLCLARTGERRASEIAEAILLHRTETYRILRDLEKKGLVYSVFEKPLKFMAVPLEKAVDLLIHAQKMKIEVLEKEKAGMVELWSTMPRHEVENSEKEVFQILEGGQQMILKANELLDKARVEVQIFASGEHLAQLYYSDFMDSLKRRSDELKFTLVTENSLKSRFFIQRMGWASGECRVVEANRLPFFMIIDRKGLLVAIQKSEERSSGIDKKASKTVALWTNYTAFVEILQMLFARLREGGRTVQEVFVRSPTP